jgi:hypothetical protein
MFAQSISGLSIFLVLWIVYPILWATGGEPVPNFDSTTISYHKLPIIADIVGFLFVNVIFASTYFVVMPWSINIMSPLWVAVIYSVGVPITYIADYLLHNYKFGVVTVIGMFIVCASITWYNIEVILFVFIGNVVGNNGKKEE